MSIGFVGTVLVLNIPEQIVYSILKQQCLNMSTSWICAGQLYSELNTVSGAILEQVCMGRKYVSPWGFGHFFHNF